MKFLRSFVFLILCTLYFVLCTSPIHAADEFSVDSNVTYSIQTSGKTVVIYNITLENNLSDVYATSYNLILQNIDAQNIQSKDEKGTAYPTIVTKNGSKTTIKIDFPDSVVGKGQLRHFTISYQNSSFAVKTGEIWEITIPRLEDSGAFKSYSIYLRVPQSFGLEAYISPKPKNIQKDASNFVYSFSRSDISSTGITAGFGQFQVFSFNLAYHLENTQGKEVATTIAIPPDTAYQKVYIENMNPKPTSVKVDSDGNWLAIYNLAAKERIDVSVAGSVQIFASNRSFPKPTDKTLVDDVGKSEYWQTDDLKIIKLAEDLKTPRAIYDYVSKNLKYDFSRVKPDTERLGALQALENPTMAICMEFTDLFIAIARAAGIPAREINGYAYTENPDLEPLGLVNDVLHAWPEYYDKTRGVWVPIDPTWASTSGGVDYFGKLDLRHFAFVIHGESDVTPYAPGSYKLGNNPQKDVFVSFGKLPDLRVSIPTISLKPVRTLPFFDSIYNETIKNPGPVALYSVNPIVYFDDKEKTVDSIEVMPPYASFQRDIIVPFSIFGKGTPETITVKTGIVSTKIATNKEQVILGSLLVVCVFLIVVIIFILFALKKITFRGLFATIAMPWQKLYERFTHKTPPNNSL